MPDDFIGYIMTIIILAAIFLIYYVKATGKSLKEMWEEIMGIMKPKEIIEEKGGVF